jgi:hypothetical protein
MALVREALDLFANSKNALILAIDHTNLAAYCIAAEDLEMARVAAREGLKWALQGQHSLGIAIVLQHFAVIGARDDAVAAARLSGYVEARLNALAYEREYTERWSLDRLMVALRKHRTESEIEALAREGAAWPEDRAIEQAMML